jgi:hypothetical protein
MPSTRIGWFLVRPATMVIMLLTACTLLQAQSGAYVSVTSYGAKGDAITHSDGVANGTATFTSSSSSFSSADVGKFIEITGAGASSGILTTTIKSVQSATLITLTASASSSGTGLYFTYGTDNTTAFRSAYNAAVPLSVPVGSYIISGNPSPISGTIPLIITGSGQDSKLLSDNEIFNPISTSGTSITNLDLEPIAHFTVVKLNPLATNPPSTPVSTATCTAPAAGTPILLDLFGTGSGFEPPGGNFAPIYPTCWNSLSAFQQLENLGPFIIVQGGDHITVSNITGNQVVIQLYDVTNSTLQNNDFTGGYGTWGCLGIFTYSPSETPTNIGDSITGNKVRYCSYSNIFWAHSSGTVVSDNISEYAGESGLKNYSPWASYANVYVSVANNIARYSLYDGFDLSADYPHTTKYVTNSTATGNVSQYNQRTGYYGDGLNWNYTTNSAISNGITGIYLDFSNSTISGNTALNNNMDSLTSSNEQNQIVIGGCCPSSNNDIENNFINVTVAGITGDAMWVGSTNSTAANNAFSVTNNTTTGGLWFNSPLLNSSGNTGWPTTFAGNVTINGNLNVTGSFSAASKSFKIDDPLDPAKKFLYHNSVESPDMMNIYNGVVQLNSRGRAEVMLPPYFEALNDSFRYQLTSIGKFDPIYIARQIKNNKFLIAGGRPGTRVSWQITGVRKDPYAQAHRVQPEVNKPKNEAERQAGTEGHKDSN